MAGAQEAPIFWPFSDPPLWNSSLEACYSIAKVYSVEVKITQLSNAGAASTNLAVKIHDLHANSSHPKVTHQSPNFEI
jgi:hypothetical protein